MSKQKCPLFGIRIIQQIEEVRLKLLGSNYDELVSFVQASILSGACCDHMITNRIRDLVGPDLEGKVAFLLEEGMNEHWYRDEGGFLDVAVR